jgi:hypothetical protein
MVIRKSERFDDLPGSHLGTVKHYFTFDPCLNI